MCAGFLFGALLAGRGVRVFGVERDQDAKRRGERVLSVLYAGPVQRVAVYDQRERGGAPDGACGRDGREPLGQRRVHVRGHGVPVERAVPRGSGRRAAVQPPCR